MTELQLGHISMNLHEMSPERILAFFLKEILRAVLYRKNTSVKAISKNWKIDHA